MIGRRDLPSFGLLGSLASPILKPQISTASIRFSRTLHFSGCSYVLSGLQAACPFALVFGGLGCAGRSLISMSSAASVPATSSDVVSVDGVDKRRCRRLNKVPMAKDSRGPVIYWMSRDQRVEDNWALLYAQKLALQRSASVHVVFCLVPKFGDATIRQFDFLLRGLKEVAAGLKAKNIPFHLKIGKASTEIPALLDELKATAVVCDMSPLRVPKQWAHDVAEACQVKEVPVVQVDAHNIVPVWAASDKQETAARTIRKKIMLSLATYLTDFPKVVDHPHASKDTARPDWEVAEKSLEVDRSVKPVNGIVPGAAAAHAALLDFTTRLGKYANDRNNPNVQALSGLSPWLHFGQISAQRCALKVREVGESKGSDVQKGCEAFIEESVVRRELSDNFCFYNENYDRLEGAAGWAQQTLKDHAKDKREYVYSLEELEHGKTHDDLWNASQNQMVQEGKMHGFLRMYWAKKILEWSPSPREALERSIKLNDRYELDGRDPNGYVGCMWSICGVHDMGWKERPVFGKIRFMNYAGCKRKFDVPAFVAKYGGGAATAASEPSSKRRKTR